MSMETNEIPKPKPTNTMHIEPGTSTCVFNQCNNVTVNNNCENVNDIKEELGKVMSYLKAKDDAKAKAQEMVLNLAQAFVKPITEALTRSIEKKNESSKAPIKKKDIKKRNKKK